MADKKQVSLELAVSTSGSEEVRSLETDVRALAKSGGDAAPEFQRLADELSKIADQGDAVVKLAALKEEIRELGAAQIAASENARLFRTDLEAAAASSKSLGAAQQEVKEGLDVAKDSVKSASRALEAHEAAFKGVKDKGEQYTKTLQELGQAVVAARTAVDNKSTALRTITKDLSEAEAAEKKLGKSYTAASADLDRANAALATRSAALKAAEAELNAAGISTENLAASQKQVQDAFRATGDEAIALQAKIVLLRSAEVDLAKNDAFAEKVAGARRLRAAVDDIQFFTKELDRARKAEDEFGTQDALSRKALATQRLRDSAPDIANWAKELDLAIEKERQFEANSNAFSSKLAQAQKLRSAAQEVEFWRIELERAEKAQDEFAATRAFDQLVASSAKLIQSKQYVQDLTAALDGADAANKNLVDSAKRSEAALAAAFDAAGVRSVAAIRAEIDGVNTALLALSRNTRVSGEDFDRAFKSGQARIATLNDELKKAPSNITATSLAVDALKSSFAQLAAVYGGIELATKFFEANVQIETLRRSLTLLVGSSSAAASQIKLLQDVANNSGQAVSGLTQNFINFIAATTSSGTSLELAREIFTRVTNAAGNLGISTQRVGLILDALGQISSKGTVSLEELRGQLGDSLPGAMAIAARGFGVTQDRLIKLVESGQVAARDFFPAFNKGLEETFGGTEKRVEGVLPAFNRFKNALTELSQTASDSSAFKALAATLDFLAANMAEVADSALFLGKAFVAFKFGEAVNGFLGITRATNVAKLELASKTAATATDSAETRLNTVAVEGNVVAHGAEVAALGAAAVERRVSTAATVVDTAAVQANTAARAGAAAAIGAAAPALTSAATAAAGAGAAITTVGTAAVAAGAATKLAAGTVEASMQGVSGVFTSTGKVAVEASIGTRALGAAGEVASKGVGLLKGAASGLVGLIGGLPGVALLALFHLKELGNGILFVADKFSGLSAGIAENRKQLKEYEDKVKETAVANAKLKESQDSATASSLGLNTSQSKLVDGFNAIIKKGGNVSDALKDITKQLELGNVEGVADASVALEALGATGQLTFDQIKSAYQGALKGVDLERFATNAQVGFGAIKQAASVAKVELDEATKAYDGSAAATARLEKAAKAAQATLAGGEAGAKALATALAAIDDEALLRVGSSVRELQTGFTTASASAINDVDRLASALDRAGAGAEDTGRLLGKSLDQALAAANTEKAIVALTTRATQLGKESKISGEQLTKFLDDAREKHDKLTPKTKELSEAAAKLGVDFRQLTTGVSESFRQGVKDIDNLLEKMVETKVTAERASPVLEDAFNKKIALAKTKEELALVRQEVEKANSAGLLLGSTYAVELEKIRKKARELSPALQQAQKDAERLGITLGDLSNSASGGVEGALKAYERLKAGGQASMQEVQKAFANTAAEAIKTAGGIIPEWVKVEAATRGMVLETDKYGTTLARVAEVGEQAGQVINKSLQEAAVAASNLMFELERIAKARNNTIEQRRPDVDKEGFALDSSGKRLTIAGQAKVGKGEFFDQQAFERDASIARGQLDPQNFVRRDVGGRAISAEVAERLKRIEEGPKLLGPQEVKAPSKPTSLVEQEAIRLQEIRSQVNRLQSASTSTVNIVINGKTTPVSTTSQADANSLIAVMQELEQAARSAGRRP